MPNDDDNEHEEEHEDEEHEDDEDEGGRKPPKKASNDERIAARERDRGRRAGARDLAKELGFSSVAAMKESLTKEADDEQENKDLTEADKVRKSADEKMRKAVAREEAAAERELNVRIERALETHLGVPAKLSPKIRKLVEGLDVDCADGDIEDAIDDLKADMPEVFANLGSSDDREEEEEDEGERVRNRRTDSTPPRPPRRKGEPKNTAAEAKNLFDRRHPNLSKQS